MSPDMSEFSWGWQYGRGNVPAMRTIALNFPGVISLSNYLNRSSIGKLLLSENFNETSISYSYTKIKMIEMSFGSLPIFI